MIARTIWCVLSLVVLIKTEDKFFKASPCQKIQTYHMENNITIDLSPIMNETNVKATANLSVAFMPGDFELTVQELKLSGPEGQVYTNPPGIEMPLLFTLDTENNIVSYAANDLDSEKSISLKKQLLNLLRIDPARITNKSAFSQDFLVNILKEGDKNITVSDQYKDVVLVLGNTGAGKTTFTQWIIGDCSKLKSKEVSEAEFIIEDELNLIGNSTIDSKTTFPKLFVDTDKNIAYYDFPGFSDTRNSAYDIATSYFITKTIENVNLVKMAFVVNYPSVRYGVDRQDFLQLLRHVTELVVDIDKFKESIAMVVTKVDNHYAMSDGKLVLVNDTTIINGIAMFLQETKADLEQRTLSKDLAEEDQLFYFNAIKFIESLLKTDGENYIKIGLFRRPSEPGLLCNMTILQEERLIMKKLIQSNLTYATKVAGDIKQTISDKSKKEINTLITEIDYNILSSICDILEKFHKFYDTRLSVVDSKIKNFDINNLDFVPANFTLISNLFDNLTQDYTVLKTLTDKIGKTENRYVLSNLIAETVAVLNITIAEKSLTDMLSVSRFVNVLQHMMDENYGKQASSLAWGTPFTEFLNTFASVILNLKHNISKLSSDFDNKVKNEISNLGSKLQENLFFKLENNNINLQFIYNETKIKYEQLANLLTPTLSNDSTRYIKNLSKILSSENNISFTNSLQTIITGNDQYFHLIAETFENVTSYANDSQIWYNFLINIYHNLFRYDVQMNKGSLLRVLRDINHNIDKKVEDSTSLYLFLQKIYLIENDYQSFEKEYKNIMHIQLTSARLKHLERVIKVSLQMPDHQCYQDGKLLITGVNVKLTDMMYIDCPNTIKLIEIFALNQIIFDVNLNATGKEMQIAMLAPIWTIPDDIRIELDGQPGNLHYPLKAGDGYYESKNGEDGKPGQPGGSGGVFFGIGENVIDVVNDKLVISAMPGDGGPGQDGGDGADGYNGAYPHIYDPKQYLKDHGLYYNQNAYDWHFLYCEWRVDGEHCSDGGNSGKGGESGFQGKPGKVHIISVDQNRLFDYRFDKGSLGEFGNRGKPGNGGTNGGYATIYWAPMRFWDQTRVEYSAYAGCRSGNTLDYSSTDIQMPNIIVMNHSRIVQEYMNYLENSLNNTVLDTYKTFYDKIKSEKIVKIYEKLDSNDPDLSLEDSCDY